MPQRMDCLQLDAWDGQLERTTTDRPAAGSGDVLVDVAATGVGLTVDKYIHGGMGSDPADLPRIPGHELVGEIVETGDGVTGLSTGQQVTAYFHIGCGHCRYCEDGLFTLCENHGGHVGVEMDGGFAEAVALPARQVVPIPQEIDPVDATVIPDAVATPYHVASQRAAIDPDDSVAVFGAGGGVGIHMVQVADHFGGDVTAVDLVDEKLDRCLEVGATHAVNATDRSPEAVLDAGGAPYDAVVDFTGDTDLLEAALDALGPRGRLVNMTAYADKTMQVAPRNQVRGETAVLGSRYCTRGELRSAADLVADGTVEPVISETVGLGGVQDLIERIADGEVLGRGAMTPT